MICLGMESTAHTLGVGICEGKKVLANARRLYKPPSGEGIIPRLAADHHAQKAPLVLEEALGTAGISLREVDLFAFSRGPGIGQCLRVSCATSKFLASKFKKPILGINHCHAHLQIAKGMLGFHDPLYVYVSGANTQIITEGEVAGKTGTLGRASAAGKANTSSHQRFFVLGETLDMGLGNLFDVFAREAKFAYPHGSEVARMASKGSYFPLPYTVKGMNFAFTGLLSAAVSEVGKRKTEDICHSLMETAFAELCEASERALCLTGKREVVACGGVAQNKRFCDMLSQMCQPHGAKFGVLPAEYNADNGAMIAYTALCEWKRGKREKMQGLSPNGYWRIDEVF
ncbi:MAG: UGMP family protein [Candidatus Micrarchaeota archaeon]|nr:UGMP family protein [Candidatus Micrarchaeota archaeon]